MKNLLISGKTTLPAFFFTRLRIMIHVTIMIDTKTTIVRTKTMITGLLEVLVAAGFVLKRKKSIFDICKFNLLNEIYTIRKSTVMKKR